MKPQIMWAMKSSYPSPNRPYVDIDGDRERLEREYSYSLKQGMNRIVKVKVEEVKDED